ncbi:MAG: hypothetical protein HWD85_12970 [Flavobacteriaceae bacterium]|nr:hypothetical protein [Flavobacteriaceae bacterium]
MATTKIQNNEVRVPFLSDKMSYITGLDPLGLQNPSSRAYTYLLNGLNVVSRRIRNYSFYCWLLNEFSKKVTSRDPKIQKEFVRKAEYIIALSSVFNGLEGINGSTYASKTLESEDTDIILSEGIYNRQGTTDNTYWKYSFGIFGQYYMGSMRQIRIIEEVADEFGNPLGLYRVTKKYDSKSITGEDLAEAFSKNIPSHKQQLLLTCIENNLINRQQLGELFPEFNMFSIPQESEENTLLIKMIFQPDDPEFSEEEPSFNRRNTFSYVLNYAHNNPENLKEHNFTRWAYYQKGRRDKNFDETLFGWYYYQFNEFFRLLCTACLNGILNRLEEEEGWIHLFNLIQQSVEGTIEELEKSHRVKSSLPVSEILSMTFGLEENLCDKMLDEKKWVSMSYAIQLLFKLFQENENFIEELSEYVHERAIDSEFDVISFFQIEFKRYQELTLSEFLKSFYLNQVIYRHRNVAYRKMVGNQSTEKFLFEDNYLRHISNFAPDYTASRIGTVITFLRDLHLIDGENKPTSAGINLSDSRNDN